MMTLVEMILRTMIHTCRGHSHIYTYAWAPKCTWTHAHIPTYYIPRGKSGNMSNFFALEPYD